jgi:hypothetical protein
MKRPRMEVNLEELDQIIERGTRAPLSESESEKLKSALHALAGMLAHARAAALRNVFCQSNQILAHDRLPYKERPRLENSYRVARRVEDETLLNCATQAALLN